MPLSELFFGFRGRIGRLTYWVAGSLVCVLAASFVFVIRIWFPTDANGEWDAATTVLIGILQLPFGWASVAIQAKRWHDRDRSGWWILIHLVPIFGSLWALIENGFLAGNTGANRFGPSPQEVHAIADLEAIKASARGEEVDPSPAPSVEPPLVLMAGAALAGAALFVTFQLLAPGEPAPSAAQTPQLSAPTATPFAVPALSGRVNDYADVLTTAQEYELNALYESLEQEIGSRIALLTIETLGGASIEDYSREVVNAWGLGRRGIDDGVLITLVRRDRKVRIAVGPGLQSIVPDDAAATIIQQMVPSFANNDFFTGLKDGSQEIARMIRARSSDDSSGGE